MSQENKGLVKIYWEDIRGKISKVEPVFFNLVDNLSPDKNFPLYLAYYPYGSVEADTTSSLFPDDHGGFYRLTDPEAPKDVYKNLSYSINTAPLGLLLDKQLELFLDLKNEKRTIPWITYTPGMFFPYSSILRIRTNRIYAPNGILSSTAGARSVFMLPNVGSQANHSNLQRDLNIKSPTPKHLYDHWNIFREIAKNSDWRCCVLYFSEKWVKKIQSDHAWVEVNKYLHEQAWKQTEYERNRVLYDMTFSMMQNKRNLKPNPYLADTVRHLFATAIGAVPGYVPTLNEDALPLHDIQHAYCESYKLKKYLPTVMSPGYFIYEKDNSSIYYSLQNPSTYVFSPRSREISNTLFELREMENIIRIFMEELSQDGFPCSDTVLGEVAKQLKFEFFHSKSDRYGIVKLSEEITNLDPRFTKIDKKYRKEGSQFSSDSQFLRGCIRISKK